MQCWMPPVQSKKEGTQVVAGYIETHDRAETADRLRGLDLLPLMEISINGAIVREFDLDQAIRRRPELILLDELAHINAPGVRHKKAVSGCGGAAAGWN
ncbi:hypothetical protein ACFTAO_21235 [Paenibacillus rhizoplanae]